MNITGIIIGALCAGGIYYFYKRGHKIRTTASELAKKDLPSNDIIELIDGELKLADIVAYLKGCALDQKKDIPFVANAKAPEFKNFFDKEFESNKESILFGVFDKNIDGIRCAKVITAPSIDKQLKDMLGNEPMIILN